jgi:hypothetical protein
MPEADLDSGIEVMVREERLKVVYERPCLVAHGM